MTKSIRFNTLNGSFDVVFRLSSYSSNNGIALEMLTFPELELYAICTVNLFGPSIDCSDSLFVFLNVNLLPGILEWMRDNEFITGVISSMRSGFVDYPFVRLNLPRIKEFSYE